MGYGTAVIGELEPDEIAADQLLQESFMKQEPEKYTPRAMLKS